MDFLGLHFFYVVKISPLQVAMSCDSDDLAVRLANLSYFFIKICMILDFPIFYDFLDIPFDILNILPWNGWDRRLYHIFPQQSHNSLISISGSHKPPSQLNEHFISIFNFINHWTWHDEIWIYFFIRREKILEELLATEEKYVDDLQSVLTGYRWFFHWIQFSWLLCLASGTVWNPRPR